MIAAALDNFDACSLAWPQRAVLQQKLRIAQDAVQGVRSSWLMLAKN